MTTESEAAQRPLLRVDEASTLLGLSTRQLYAWIAGGAVPSDAVLKIGRRLYLRRNALLRWAAGEDGAERSAATAKTRPT